MSVNQKCFESGTANVINVSGGKDSLAQWLLAIEQGVPNIFPVFADTGHEHHLTMEYLDMLEQKLGKINRVKADFTDRISKKREYIREHWQEDLMTVQPGRWRSLTKKPKTKAPTDEPTDPFAFSQQRGEWIWITAIPGLSSEQAKAIVERAIAALVPTGNPFIDLCLWKGRFPSSRARFCSTELKHEPVKVQMVEPLLYQYDDVICWQGVRAQESPERAALSDFEVDVDNTPGLHVYRPILNWKHEDVFTKAKQHGIEPNPLYKMGCSRVGCMPCVNVNKNELREIFERFPAVPVYMDAMESLVSAASKRQNSTFFFSGTDARKAQYDTRLVTLEEYGFSTYRDWAFTSRGGKNFDLLAAMTDRAACNSVYAGVCE